MQYVVKHNPSPAVIPVILKGANRLVDLVSEGYDQAVRTGKPSHTRLIATRDDTPGPNNARPAQ